MLLQQSAEYHAKFVIFWLCKLYLLQCFRQKNNVHMVFTLVILQCRFLAIHPWYCRFGPSIENISYLCIL